MKEAGMAFSCKEFLDNAGLCSELPLLCPILSKKLDASLELGRCRFLPASLQPAEGLQRFIF